MARFDYFVVFAEMRTGSNHLEESLSAFSNITMFGEVYNPRFVGGPFKEEILGQTLEMRDANPMALFDAMLTENDGLPGFRFFHDHDARILDRVLPDTRCAKIILTRNPLDAYISRKIASATGQWRLRNQKEGVTTKVEFKAAEFDAVLQAQKAFQEKLLKSLQTSGQTAFYLRYEDIGSLDVINGIAAFLGLDDRLEALPNKIKRQNPGPLVNKVTNPGEMEAHVATLDPFALGETPNFEPQRGPAVPQIQVAADSGVVHVPVPGGPTAEITEWLTRLDGARPRAGFNQGQLKDWLKSVGTYQSFAVVRHPLARAHHIFCRFMLPRDIDGFSTFRRKAIGQFRVPIPRQGPDSDYDLAAHRTAFLAYLGFLRVLLEGQSALRLPAACASPEVHS